MIIKHYKMIILSQINCKNTERLQHDKEFQEKILQEELLEAEELEEVVSEEQHLDKELIEKEKLEETIAQQNRLEKERVEKRSSKHKSLTYIKNINLPQYSHLVMS